MLIELIDCSNRHIHEITPLVPPLSTNSEFTVHIWYIQVGHFYFGYSENNQFLVARWDVLAEHSSWACGLQWLIILRITMTLQTHSQYSRKTSDSKLLWTKWLSSIPALVLMTTVACGPWFFFSIFDIWDVLGHFLAVLDLSYH